MKMLADATLPYLDIAFPPPFEITRYYPTDNLSLLLENQTFLLCRSTLTLSDSLLDKAKTLAYVGTASSGRDHIDENALSSRGITLFDAQGSNALAVADYVMATLAFLEQHKHFKAQKAAIIGLGAVGSEVAKRLSAANFAIIPYDPLKHSKDPSFSTASLAEVLRCPLICVHANLHATFPHPSYQLINDAFLQQLQPDTVIINASRGNIVDEKALLKCNKQIIYCTDVFSNEPSIDPAMIDYATLCTPHIAGHSREAKDNAIFMLSQKMHAALSLPAPAALRSAAPSFRASFPTPFSQMTPWQTLVLSLYNPHFETQLLKASASTANPDANLKNTFLTLRAAHQARHDFCHYAFPYGDHCTQRDPCFSQRLNQILGKEYAPTE